LQRSARSGASPLRAAAKHIATRAAVDLIAGDDAMLIVYASRFDK